MTESYPPEVEQARQLHRTLTEKVLDKACSDPQWKQLLIEDPEVAMQEADFPEDHQLFEPSGGAEVGGHIGVGVGNVGVNLPGGPSSGQVQIGTGGGCTFQCARFTALWTYSQFGNI